MKSAFFTVLWLEATTVVSFWLCDAALFIFSARFPDGIDLGSRSGGETLAGISLLVSLACTALVFYRLVRRGLPGVPARDMEGQPVRRHRSWIALWLVLMTPCAGALIGIGVTLDLFPMPNSGGPFRRAQLEAIVEQVRRQPGYPIAQHEYILDDLAHPASLRLWDRAIRRDPNVFSQATHDGSLRVVIVTYFGGHAVTWGFAYSDAPLVPTEENNMTVIDVPGPVREVRPHGRIDDHWWRVYDDLE